MQWNKLGRELDKNKNNNPFFTELNQTRQILVKRAFGLLPSKSPLRYKRDEKGGKIGDGLAYQEDFIEAREFIGDIFELWANRLGAQKGQVVQAFVTGNPRALEMSVRRILESQRDAVMNANKLKPADAQTPLPAIPDNLDTLIWQSFQSAFAVMTSHERHLAGRDAEVARLKQETAKVEAAKPKGNVSKAAKVINRKQAQRQKAAVGA